jgi:type II secretory pathway predicted ATPase ExeA
MYERHFGLASRPFPSAPQAAGYVPTPSCEQARQTLSRCVERGEGIGVLVGPAGTGKTLLCQVLASQFQGRFQVAHLAGARLVTRRALLQNILFELKLPYRELDEGELRLMLVDHLVPRAGGPAGLLLLLDEAHTLPLRLLEEVRLLTNVVHEGQSRVRLVLAGGMALEERLAHPKLESLHQRIAARCYLQPLGRDETARYIQQQLLRVGGEAERIIPPAAQAAIHTATDGIPRLINQLCDHALLLAAVRGSTAVDPALVEEAWADLQQLPLPVAEKPAQTATPPGIIEFGQLDDPEPVAGTIGPAAHVAAGNAAAHAAMAQLDTITQSLARFDEPAEDVVATAASPSDAFVPCAASTEVELFFDPGHDPFGGHWEEEEIVIDRYASLEQAALRTQRVVSQEGRALGAAVQTRFEAATSPPSVPPEPPRVIPVVHPRPQPGRDGDDEMPATIAAQADFHPASDPVLPEHPAPGRRRGPLSLRQLAQDDRDIILVEPQEDDPLPPRPRRGEYRQLFSRLRAT